MKKTLLAGSAIAALTAGAAFAEGHLAFAPGDGDFSWDSYDAYVASAPDLSGQTLTIAGPWLSPEAEIFDNMLAYFEAATGVKS